MSVVSPFAALLSPPLYLKRDTYIVVLNVRVGTLISFSLKEPLHSFRLFV